MTNGKKRLRKKLKKKSLKIEALAGRKGWIRVENALVNPLWFRTAWYWNIKPFTFIHFPISSGVSEWASKRTSEQTSKWRSTYDWIYSYSGWYWRGIFVTLCHFLSLFVTFCHSLEYFLTFFQFFPPFVMIWYSLKRFRNLRYSLSVIVTFCHSLILFGTLAIFVTLGWSLSLRLYHSLVLFFTFYTFHSTSEYRHRRKATRRVQGDGGATGKRSFPWEWIYAALPWKWVIPTHYGSEKTKIVLGHSLVHSLTPLTIAHYGSE